MPGFRHLLKRWKKDTLLRRKPNSPHLRLGIPESGSAEKTPFRVRVKKYKKSLAWEHGIQENSTGEFFCLGFSTKNLNWKFSYRVRYIIYRALSTKIFRQP